VAIELVLERFSSSGNSMSRQSIHSSCTTCGMSTLLFFSKIFSANARVHLIANTPY